MFKIGIGRAFAYGRPMIAARRFAQFARTVGRCAAREANRGRAFRVAPLTGLGHRTDRAVIMDCCGEAPRTVDPDTIDKRFDAIARGEPLRWLGKHAIHFDMQRDLILNRTTFLPQHPNGLRCTAWDDRCLLLSKEYFSWAAASSLMRRVVGE